MRRLFPILLIAVLVGALYMVNQGISKNATKDHDDDDDQKQEQKSDKPAPKPVGETGVHDLIPAEITVGNPATAKYKVTFGWVYDENVVRDQAMVSQIMGSLQQWASAGGDKVYLEIVNLDMPAEDLSPAAAQVQGLGVTINGSSTVMVNGHPTDLSGNILQPNMNPPAVMSAITSATRQ